MHLQLLPCLLPTHPLVHNGYHQCWAVIRRNQMNATKQLAVLYACNKHDTPTQQMKKTHRNLRTNQITFLENCGFKAEISDD